jgi:PAS domain S-box-containing protein
MSKKALVIDNDFFFVEFLAELLEERGYEVMKAYDGKEGISKLKEESVDVIFVDLVMPKIDGKQFIAFVRNKFPDHSFPLVSVSGTIIEQLDDLNKIGADYYIAKGPMEQMADQINIFMDKLEKQPFPIVNGEDIVEPLHLNPRQTTVELMDTVSFYQAVIENIGIGIIMVDKDARIINANSLALAIVGRSLEEILNYPITAIFPKTEKANLINVLKGVIQGEESRKITFYAPIHSQEIRIVVTPLTIDSKVTGWILVMEDTRNG